MSDAAPKKAGKKGKKAAAAADAEGKRPKPPAAGAKKQWGHYDRQVVDYVRTATATNIWYYRCARGRAGRPLRAAAPAAAPATPTAAVGGGLLPLPQRPAVQRG